MKKVQLLMAGYTPEQIYSCQLNDALEECPCDKNGPIAECPFRPGEEVTE
jgi:hypothetical protein